MAGTVASVGGELDTIGFAEARSALAWWLEAGVDVAVQEEARDWLKPASAPKPASAEQAPPNVRQPSHETLSELQSWLASTVELPLASATAKRVLPHGRENASVMLLTDPPTIDDYAAGQPIGGEAWELTKRMLAAIGIDATEAYCAPLSCFHTPGSRLDPKDLEECAKLARQHIRLARPKRLLLLGEGPCSALLGKNLVQARGHVHKVEGVRTVATFTPRQLIKRPLDKALAWRDLLLLMEGES